MKIEFLMKEKTYILTDGRKLVVRKDKQQAAYILLGRMITPTIEDRWFLTRQEACGILKRNRK